jgi:hypothetical protein
MDFFQPLVNVSFQSVSDKMASESVSSGGDGEFSSDYPCDFSSLPPLSIMQQCMLEDQAVLWRSCTRFQRAKQRFFCT